ncbi:MAG: amidohydrolase family protein [Pseudomonadota bacterium]
MIRATLFLIFAFTLPAQAQDIFFFNAKGYTLQDGALIRFDALLVKNGRVQAAGPENLLRPYAGDIVQRDLAGKTLLPGFVDAGVAVAGSTSNAGDPVAQVESRLKNKAKLGFTTIHDTSVTQAGWDALLQLADEKRLPIRVFGWIKGFGSDFDSLSGRGPLTSLANDILSLRGVSIEVASKGCALAAPVALRNKLARANMRGYQAAVTLTGCVPPNAVYAAFSDVLAYSTFDGRHRLVYGYSASELRALYKPQSIVQTVVALPSQNGALSITLKGDRAIISAGLYAAGSTALAAFSQMNAALEDDRTKALEALSLAPAYASFMEDRLGSLDTGKWADFIILDRNIMTMDASAIASAQVVETWVAGRQVFAAN